MIKSMTGFGRAEAEIGTGKVTIEIRTLNAKSADINIKTSLLPKDKELGVRALLAAKLGRGTIDFYANYQPNTSEGERHINADLVKAYYAQALALREELSVGNCENGNGKAQMNGELFNSILRLPDILDSKGQDIITEENWGAVAEAIDKAIEALNDYRATEGVALYKDVTSRVRNILELENEVEGFEAERIETTRAKILAALEELGQKPDASRFEQEMIFYLEKLDINEEKVRLRQHCKYFMDTIDSDPQPGKKLGFIIQEMGREINTTGSKANHAGIQKAVVRMKDELEKIREQSMNIL